MARESIEALLNPSLRVSRPVAACARCRSAKIKCDGKLPACSACERAGKAQDCSSANDDFARGKERSYVAALETAIQRLQRRIGVANGQDDRRDSVMSFSMLRRPSLQQRRISGSKRKEASDVDELVSDFGFLTVNATSRDFNGFSSTMSFTKLLLATAMRPDAPEPLDTPLPSRQEITPLLNFYFENLYVMLPFFSETDFMSSVSRVYADTDAPDLATPYDIWSVRLVLAIASTCLGHHQINEPSISSSQQISAALKVAEYVLHPGALSGIQALLLLVQYSLNAPHHFDCWYVVGMASRLLVDLGLHCEPSPEAKISKEALDLRRRMFYCTYALDRFVSMSFGLAFSFTDDSAPTVLLPTLSIEQEQRSPSQLFLRSVKPSLFVFDIRRVQSSFYQRTRWSARKQWDATIANDFLTSTLNDIEQWRQMLPDSLTAQHSQFFYLEYLYSKVLVVSPNQVIPVSLLSNQHKAHIFNYTVQYAEHIYQMTQSANCLSLLTIADFYRARYVAQQFLNLMWSDFDAVLRRDLHKHDPSMTALNITQQAINLFTLVSKILDIAQQKFGTAELRQRFEQESAVLLGRLKSRFQELSTPPATGAFGQNVASIPQIYDSSQTVIPHDQSILENGGYTSMQAQQQTQPLQQMYQQGQQPQMYNANATESIYAQPEAQPQFDLSQLNPEQAAPQHGNLQRAATWATHGQTSDLLPPLPNLMTRRSYEFNG